MALAPVYSCPGLRRISTAVGRLGSWTHKDPGVVRQRPERHVQRLVHLLAVALEEPAAACWQSEKVDHKGQ